MVVLLKKNPDKTQLDSLTQWLQGDRKSVV